MDDKRNWLAGRSARSGAGSPEVASRHQLQRWNLALTLYGVSAGLGTTALGAWSASAITGSARIVVWIAVTGVLSAGAAWLAAPIVALWARPVRSEQAFRRPGPL